ncbi:hypothetical protein AGMMS50218_08290 [Actinomycetota bacterium]|nr:hypothetical protein AGMMS50218_08290 [Actinomycetota bacterium]
MSEGAVPGMGGVHSAGGGGDAVPAAAHQGLSTWDPADGPLTFEPYLESDTYGSVTCVARIYQRRTL